MTCKQITHHVNELPKTHTAKTTADDGGQYYVVFQRQGESVQTDIERVEDKLMLTVPVLSVGVWEAEIWSDLSGDKHYKGAFNVRVHD